MRSTCNTSKTSTTSLWTSRRRLTEFGMQLCGQPMSLYNINANLIRTIECLYDKATSAVYLDNNIGEWFRTTIGVRQGCLLSPHSLQHLFRENNGWRTKRPWRNSQHRRQDNCKLEFCWRHWRPSWTRARASQLGKAPWKGLHVIWHADQCRKDPVDDK